MAEVCVPVLSCAHRFLLMLQAISMGEGVQGCALDIQKLPFLHHGQKKLPSSSE